MSDFGTPHFSNALWEKLKQLCIYLQKTLNLMKIVYVAVEVANLLHRLLLILHIIYAWSKFLHKSVYIFHSLFSQGIVLGFWKCLRKKKDAKTENILLKILFLKNFLKSSCVYIMQLTFGLHNILMALQRKK